MIFRISWNVVYGVDSAAWKGEMKGYHVMYFCFILITLTIQIGSQYRAVSNDCTDQGYGRKVYGKPGTIVVGGHAGFHLDLYY